MGHIENMFPFYLFSAKWLRSMIVSNAGVGGGRLDEGGRTSLSRTPCYVPTEAEMRKVFARFDVNGDGQICSSELGTFMERLGFSLTDDEVKALVTTVDEDRSGSVEFDEFYKLYATLSGSDQSADEKTNEKEHDNNLKSAFEVFDKNRDGYISVEELQLVLKSLGMKEGHSYKKCQHMINGVDADRNGKVDFEEFKKLMSSGTVQF